MKGSLSILLSISFVPPLSYVLLLLLLQSTVCYAQQQQQQRDTQPEDEEFIISDAAMNLRKQALRYTVCTDLREACAEWAAEGECHTNPAYMGPHCPVSCHTCHLMQPRVTETPFRPVIPHTLKASGWEFPDAAGRDLGVPQLIHDRELRDAILVRVEQARNSLRLESTTTMCHNHNVNCTTWAVQGECETNPEYMRQYCAPVCGAC